MTAFKEEFSKPETLCWQCSKPYLITAAQCPHCLANNANVDLDAAAKQQLATAPGGGEGLVEELPLLLKYDGPDLDYVQRRLEQAAARLASLEADAGRSREDAERLDKLAELTNLQALLDYGAKLSDEDINVLKSAAATLMEKYELHRRSHDTPQAFRMAIDEAIRARRGK